MRPNRRTRVQIIYNGALVLTILALPVGMVQAQGHGGGNGRRGHGDVGMQFGGGAMQFGGGTTYYDCGAMYYGSGAMYYASGVTFYGSGVQIGSGLQLGGSGMQIGGFGMQNGGFGVINYGGGMNRGGTRMTDRASITRPRSTKVARRFRYRHHFFGRRWELWDQPRGSDVPDRRGHWDGPDRRGLGTSQIGVGAGTAQMAWAPRIAHNGVNESGNLNIHQLPTGTNTRNSQFGAINARNGLMGLDGGGQWESRVAGLQFLGFKALGTGNVIRGVSDCGHGGYRSDGNRGYGGTCVIAYYRGSVGCPSSNERYGA